ncbi:MAG: hypothetical protein V7711_15660 [Pseudomonadales bacterium]
MRYKTLIPLFFLLFSYSTHAINLSFLKDSNLRDFSQQERESFIKTIDAALDQTPDEKIISWSSPTSSLEGKILPMTSYETDNIVCRRVLFEINSDKRRKERLRFDICKGDEGWKITETPLSEFTRSDLDSLDRLMTDSLDNEPDGTPVSWTNPETDNSAVLVILSTREGSEPLCRDLTISIIGANNRTSDGRFTLCKKSDGEWQRNVELEKKIR